MIAHYESMYSTDLIRVSLFLNKEDIPSLVYLITLSQEPVSVKFLKEIIQVIKDKEWVIMRVNDEYNRTYPI